MIFSSFRYFSFTLLTSAVIFALLSVSTGVYSKSVCFGDTEIAFQVLLPLGEGEPDTEWDNDYDSDTLGDRVFAADVRSTIAPHYLRQTIPFLGSHAACHSIRAPPVVAMS
jgi:hypothetical protein